MKVPAHEDDDTVAFYHDALGLRLHSERVPSSTESVRFHFEVMPAVDYRMPDGLWPEELREALAVVLASPLAVGMEVTIYNPTFDTRERSAARVLARAITAAFTDAA